MTTQNRQKSNTNLNKSVIGVVELLSQCLHVYTISLGRYFLIDYPVSDEQVLYITQLVEYNLNPAQSNEHNIHEWFQSHIELTLVM